MVTLIGCAFAAVYKIGMKQLISFCADTGFTSYGLVEQNHELPDEMLMEMGVDTISIPRANVSRTD
ncbi:MAG: hypothetical protein K0Q87_487 [Neobacillus sp.]|nr:hypothetical protein [Neobacillus sp.]